MAYDRAPRSSDVISQTGPYVAPNSYDVNFEDTCQCKGTNWAPFLSWVKRSTLQTQNDAPSPDTYYPKINDHIIGGNSLKYTAPRFPMNEGKNLTDMYFEPRLPVEEPPPRLKGYMYHCAVPFTLLSYMPTIPKPTHIGYDILQDKTMTECCDPDYDTTIGPAFYELNFDTFANYYKGSFWSRYSGRTEGISEKMPGVGDYNLIRESTPKDDYLTKLRHERKKNACSLRYMEDLVRKAIRNNFPAPNQYSPEKHKCIRGSKRIVLKKPDRPKPEVEKAEPDTGPAPNQYYDHRTALYYLVKPSCKKGLSAFLTNAPRFQKATEEKRPSANQYKIPTFVDEWAKKVSPYAVRKTAFDTSVPKKLYYLPPDYPPIIKKKPCKCSAIPAEPELPAPKPKPIYPFTSKTKRFQAPLQDYPASCASYNIQKSFEFITAPKSFRRTKRYNFIFCEQRFKKSEEITSTIQTPVHYLPGRTNNSGSFSHAKRFTTEVQTGPGPLDYKIRSKSKAHQTFNVTLGGNYLTNFQKYRMKLKLKQFKKKNIPVTKAEPNCETKIKQLKFPEKRSK